MIIKDVLIIHNPTAGWRGNRKLSRFAAKLRLSGFNVTTRTTKWPGDAEHFAASFSPANYDCVVAAGGDGTVNEVVNGLSRNAGSQTIPLAVLPIGTANVFAMEIGFNQEINQCVDALKRGVTDIVHLGSINDRLFVQMAGVGFDALVVSNIRPKHKRRLGKLAYVLETLSGFVRYRMPMYTVSLDGIDYKAASIVIANGHFYGGRFTCAPNASVFNKPLEVCLFKSEGAWNAVRYAFGLIRNRLTFYPDVEIISGQHIEIGDGPRGPAQADGDIVSHLPISVRAGQRSIPVILPAT